MILTKHKMGLNILSGTHFTYVIYSRLCGRSTYCAFSLINDQLFHWERERKRERDIEREGER